MSDGLRVRRLRIYLALLISLALSIPVAFLVPDLFPEFRAPLAGSGFIDKPGGCEYYEDLDRDGFSERIILFNNTLQEASVKIIEENGTIGAHYYLRGQMLRYKTNCSFCDRYIGEEVPSETLKRPFYKLIGQFKQVIHDCCL